MTPLRALRAFTAALAVLALGATVAAHPTSPVDPSAHRAGDRTSQRSDLRVAATTSPTNAAKIFRWGRAQWVDEFIGPLKPVWAVNQKSQVRNQNGMLTLDSTATSGTVVARLTGRQRQYGRWEARVRSRQYRGATATPYRVAWELVPTTGERCGARGIVLSDYTLGRSVATAHLRNLPDVDFSASRTLPLNNQFHTYAVEVTPDHISWFVDTRVVMTERRPAARTGASYDVRFRLVGAPGKRMNRGRMQMDWVRYYTLARRNALPITAPQAQSGTYADAC